MVLDGRLAKMKKEQANQIPMPPKPVESTKMGNVMKCPSCGEPYVPGTGKCPSCGHLFQNIDAVKSSVRLTEGIEKLINECETKMFSDNLSDNTLDKIANFIRTFPIPNAKDDLLDFIVNLDAKRKANDYQRITDACADKYRETVNRAKIVFPGDKQLEQAIAMTDKGYISPMKILMFAGIGSVILFIALIIIGIIMS
jgi:uncharacterized Zn finger protein (UPF0148 family)